MEKMLVIGIAGGSGSGKSTITEQLKAEFKDDVAIIRYDDYYKANHDMPYEERCRINYDCPDAFETHLMASHIRQLKSGSPVACPVYDYTIHDRTDKVQMIYPATVLLIDGILILNDPELRDLMDIKLYVDTDADTRILRRIRRDMSERGRSLDSIISQYLTTVKPMHEAFVEPSKKYADIIIPEGGHNSIAMDILKEKIGSFISRCNQ